MKSEFLGGNGIDISVGRRERREAALPGPQWRQPAGCVAQWLLDGVPSALESPLRKASFGFGFTVEMGSCIYPWWV